MDEEDLQALLAEQRRELTAAMAVDSDLDYAFQLQMQEALTVSLPPPQQASSSSSSSSQPPLPPPTVLLPDDAVPAPGIAQLFAEEIVNYERARSDRELVEAETKRMRENLNRLIHDQVFAREVHEMPELEWSSTGNYLQRPYGDGEGSSAGTGTFRVYSKGLVSEGETVDNVEMTLAGIGVVICDMSDCPIFELCKPLPLADGGTSEDIVEMRAVIEGLNAALTLGIKRVTIYLDNNSVHQYVTRKGLPGDNKVLTLVDQVRVLGRKFDPCLAFLVGQKEVRLAFRLARDAIILQATRPAENVTGKNLIETCTICMEDTDVGQIFSVNSCLHRYCFSCMKRHVEAKLHLGQLPKCPHDGCKSEMKIENCKRFLPPELYDIMYQRIKETSIPAAEKIYCPYSNCSALMSKIEVRGYAANLSADAHQAGARKCMRCDGLFCINCRVPWHVNMTCFEYKMQNPYPSVEEAKLRSLAKRSCWRQCPECSHLVELKQGCYHIYCRCGHEFCYTCGAAWKNKKATCNCPIWDEHNIIYAERNMHPR